MGLLKKAIELSVLSNSFVQIIVRNKDDFSLLKYVSHGTNVEIHQTKNEEFEDVREFLEVTNKHY